MTSSASPLTPPVLTCTAAIGAALDVVAGADPAFMSTADRARALRELTVIGTRVEGLRLQVASCSDDVAKDEGARSIGGWLAHETRTDPRAANRLTRLATALGERFPHTLAAVRAGAVSVAQAEVITEAVDALPDDIDAHLRGRAELHLLEQAQEFGPTELRRLGEKVLEVVAPDRYEQLLKDRLDAEDAAATHALSLRTRSMGAGQVRITIRTKQAVADAFQTVLHAYASPRRQHLTQQADAEAAKGSAASAESPESEDERDLRLGHGLIDPETGERIPHHQVMGHAFTAFVESLDPARLPRHGGGATTLVVTVDHDRLRDQLGLPIGETSAGTFLTPGEVRRLVCNARILPAVLGGESQLLDLGRSSRLFKGAGRTALDLRDRTCRAVGCQVPAAWCEAHHKQPWSKGGRTDVDDGVLLCSWHHHRAHDPTYEVRYLPNGDVRFHRRQ